MKPRERNRTGLPGSERSAERDAEARKAIEKTFKNWCGDRPYHPGLGLEELSDEALQFWAEASGQDISPQTKIAFLSGWEACRAAVTRPARTASIADCEKLLADAKRGET